MRMEIGKKYLITCDKWFLAPDGKNYLGVFGTVHSVTDSKEVLGITPNRNSTNWYVEIGNMIVAGCQIHYAVRCESCHKGNWESWSHDDKSNSERATVFTSPNRVYFSDGDV